MSKKNRNPQSQEHPQSPETVETEQEAVVTETQDEPVPQAPEPADEPVTIEAPVADSGVLATPVPHMVAEAAKASPTVAEARTQETADVSNLREYLSTYALNIEEPENQNAATGSRLQIGFYRTIFGVLSNTTNFEAQFETLMTFMKKEAAGVCDSRRIFRYYPNLPVDKQEAERILSLVRFCLTMSEAPTYEAGLKQVDIGRLLAKVSNTQITQNISTWIRNKR